MNLIPPPAEAPAARRSLEAIQSHLDAGLRQIGAAIAAFNEGYDEFWRGTDAEVVARAELLGPAGVQLMFERNTALGLLLNAAITERNAALAAAGQPPLTGQVMRVVAARDLQWTELGFVVIPPPEPEEPEPEAGGEP